MFRSTAPPCIAVALVAALLALDGCGSPDQGVPEPAPASQVPAAPEAPKSEPLPQSQGTELVLGGPVVFNAGTDVLARESESVLEPILQYMEVKTDVTLLRIEGHTDGDGDPKQNQDLSERRAMAVAHWLVKKGIDCRRLLPVGFGGAKPIAPDDTPQNKAQNQRIAFVNAALRNRPIGGMPVDGGGTIAGDPCN